MNKLTKTLNILLTIQILLYTWAMYIVYSTSRDGIDDLAGLGALVPMAVFVVIGVVNIVLLLIYVIKVKDTKGQKFSVPTLVLTSIIVLLAIFYNVIVELAGSGPD